MIITPHLGIGDLLILKMKEISNDLNITHININLPLINKYCEDIGVKINFITNFILLLFPNVTISKNDIPCDFYIMDNYKLNNVYLYDYIHNSMIHIENKYTDYIVFHTKLRLDNLIDKVNVEILPELNIFFENFKTSKKIIILGEKNIGQNLETRLHKTISLYDNLLLLNKNNDVLDLTTNILTCGNINFNDFLSDITLINNAVCNITFGIGGPLSICKAFSKNNISFIPFIPFIPFYDLSIYKKVLDDFNNIDNTIVENISDLNNKLYNYI